MLKRIVYIPVNTYISQTVESEKMLYKLSFDNSPRVTYGSRNKYLLEFTQKKKEITVSLKLCAKRVNYYTNDKRPLNTRHDLALNVI